MRGIKGQPVAFFNSRVAAADVASVSIAYPAVGVESQIITGTLGMFSVKRPVDGKMRTVTTRNPAPGLDESGINLVIL